MPDLSHIKAGLRVVGDHGVVVLDPGYSLRLDQADMLRVGRPKSVKPFFEVNGQSVRWVESLSWSDLSHLYLWLENQQDKLVVVAEHMALPDIGWFLLLTSSTDPRGDHCTAIRAPSVTNAFRMAYDVYLWSGREAAMNLDHRIQDPALREMADVRMGLNPDVASAANKYEGYVSC